MIDLNLAIALPLSSQEQYDIINFALQAANDNGFLDRFIFEHALWCKTVCVLMDDIPDDIQELVNSNPLQAWDRMLEEEIMQNFFYKYVDVKVGDTLVLDYFGSIAAYYFESYEAYLLSIGGALSQTDMMSTDNLEDFKQSLQDFMTSENTLKTLDIADSWGMNNQG